MVNICFNVFTIWRVEPNNVSSSSVANCLCCFCFSHMFDVTVGSVDEAEVCELVGLLLLLKMKHLFGCKCVLLYGDDGIAVLNNISRLKTDRTQKQLIKLFQDYGMKISVESNLTQTDDLDATLNLNTEIF